MTNDCGDKYIDVAPVAAGTDCDGWLSLPLTPPPPLSLSGGECSALGSQQTA